MLGAPWQAPPDLGQDPRGSSHSGLPEREHQIVLHHPTEWVQEVLEPKLTRISSNPGNFLKAVVTDSDERQREVPHISSQAPWQSMQVEDLRFPITLSILTGAVQGSRCFDDATNPNWWVHNRSSTTLTAHPEVSRRCFAFSPSAQAGDIPAVTAFRRLQPGDHKTARIDNQHSLYPPDGPLWTLLAFLFRFLGFGSPGGIRHFATWASLEHHILEGFSLVFGVVLRLFSFLVGLLLGAGSATVGRHRNSIARCAGQRLLGRPRAQVAWHPHADILASLSAEGQVALHVMAGTFTRGKENEENYRTGPQDARTVYFEGYDAEYGIPLCLEWQPNCLHGTLAVGFSGGCNVWRRRSAKAGWVLDWGVHGASFGCCAVAWAPDGRCLAAACDALGGLVRVWPHTTLIQDSAQETWCIQLRRWGVQAVESIRWSPDGQLLVTSHIDGLVQLWDTRTWDIGARVRFHPLLVERPLEYTSTSLAWCDGLNGPEVLGTAYGQLFELRGLGGLCGATACEEPASRIIGTPTTPMSGAESLATHVAVCPRTSQRIAVLVEDSAANGPLRSRVLIYERFTSEGWQRHELTLRGTISAAGGSLEPDDGRGVGLQDLDIPAIPVAVAFAGNDRRKRFGQVADSSYEGSLLAVYWECPDPAAGPGRVRAEVRTYPMHYLPDALLRRQPGVAF